MTFTYSPDALDESTLQRLRFEIGDTVEGGGVLPGGANFQDEELLQVIAEGTTLYKAAGVICEMLSTRWTLPNYRVGPVSEDYGDIGKMWKDRAAHYREIAAAGGSGSGADG